MCPIAAEVFIIQPVERIVFLLCEFLCEKGAKGFYYTARGENCVPAVLVLLYKGWGAAKVFDVSASLVRTANRFSLADSDVADICY